MSQTTNRKLTVDLAERSYDIHIGSRLLGNNKLIDQVLKNNQQVMIVTNTTVAPLYLEQTKQMFAAQQCETVILPDGEKYKTLDTLNIIFTALLEKRFERSCCLVALGGGVVGDITGFAAASYQRGVNFIQIPTTVLAQVDSSVGGKTGVNHPAGKNMIGAFYQPLTVIADTSTLQTLDDRQLSAGIAEIIKYGLIRDLAFLNWLEENMGKLLAKDEEALAYAVDISCQNKAAVVAEDELEGGVRATLNLGHTFGHAVESGMGYGVWLHGEAVAVGMMLAAKMSAKMGWLTEDDVTRVEELLVRSNLPTELPKELPADEIVDLMSVDKKVIGGKVRLVLLKELGKAVVTDDFEQEILLSTLART